MKNILITLLALCAFVSTAVAGAPKKAEAQTAAWRYEIEPVNVSTQGTCVIKVSSYSKKARIAEEQDKKNAVHGVIYKGVPAKDRIPAKKPLVTAQEAADHQKFFDDFFADGGAYMQFVALTTSGAPEITKVGKEYKVGITVTVSYSELRNYLEQQGVIKKLGAGF